MSAERENSPINYKNVPEEFFYGLDGDQVPMRSDEIEIEVVGHHQAVVSVSEQSLDLNSTTIKTSAIQD